MSTEMKDGYVKVERKQSIATIEFHHPRSNSLPAELLESIARSIQDEGLNKLTKVVVLRSAGDKSFCSGASFDELSLISSEEQGLRFFSGFSKVINAMRKIPQFIIARIHSKCVGGGVGLAAAADYAIAVKGADIKLSELTVGIGPFVVGPAVERKIGVSAFSELTIDSSTWRTAEWARNKGLYAELHGDIEGLDSSIKRLSAALACNNPEAMYELKKLFWKGTEDWDYMLLERAAISGRLIVSDYSKAFIENFKRKA